LTKPDNYETN